MIVGAKNFSPDMNTDERQNVEAKYLSPVVLDIHHEYF